MTLIVRYLILIVVYLRFRHCMKNNSSIVKYCHVPNEGEYSFSFDYVRIVWSEHLSLHQQRTWELSHVMVGKGIRVIGDTIAYFSQGEVVLIPPDIPHCWSYDESVSNDNGEIENITIAFPDTFLQNFEIAFPEYTNVISKIRNRKDAVSFHGHTLEQMQEVIASMIGKTKVEQIPSFIKLLLLIASPENINTVGSHVIEENQNKRLQQIYWYVMNHFQQAITLDGISKFVNMEKTSFCTFFKKMTGKTFFTYLTEYRIESSCHMLQKTKKPISEICFASGFRDIPYYNRIFKKNKKITPTAYRELMLREQ